MTPRPRRRTIAVDWDGTLVDAASQEWLPHAKLALQAMLAEPSARVVIHTCRANWPEGLASIEAKLDRLFTKAWRQLGLTVVGKPSADVYIDNLALRFTGDWHKTMRELASC